MLTGLVLFLLTAKAGREEFSLDQLARRDVFAPSLIAAVLFCVHPQHAESVIWVAERKDLLSALFYILALISYIYQRAAAGANIKLWPFGFFVLAIMSKSMAITLPAVLVLLDFTLLQRSKEREGEQLSDSVMRIAIVEKIHYHLVAIAVAVITILSQGVSTLEQPTILERLLISAAAVEHYVATFVVPIDLLPFYPVEIVGSSALGLWSLALALIVFLLLVLNGKYRQLAVLFFGYFFISISPVIGIIKVGDQAFADRYTYLTMIGFYILVAYGVKKILDVDNRARIPAYAIISLVLAYLAYSTHEYKNTWQDDLTLWTVIEREYPDTSLTISNSFGLAHLSMGDYLAAQRYFETAIDLEASHPRAYVNLAAVYQRLGEVENFQNTFVRGVENNPDNAELMSSAGFAFLSLNRDDEALEYFIQALELEENFPPALMGVGNLSLKRGDAENAVSMLQLVPEDSDVEFPARLLLAQAYARSDKGRAVLVLEELRAKYGRDEEIDSIIGFINQM